MHMNPYARQRITALIAVAGALALTGCAGMNSGAAPDDMQAYRCDQGLTFSVSFVNDTAVLKGARGDDVLLRDAGGQGAQTVYSNPRLRAEFGMGEGGRGAALQYLKQPLSARCQRN